MSEAEIAKAALSEARLRTETARDAYDLAHTRLIAAALAENAALESWWAFQKAEDPA